jgi:hypothetical protein
LELFFKIIIKEKGIFFISKNQVHYFDFSQDYAGILMHFNEVFLAQNGNEIDFFLKGNIFNDFYKQPFSKLGNDSTPIFEEYIRSLREKRIVRAIQILNEVAEKGYSVIDILDSFFLFVKTSTHFTEDEKYNVIPVICKYINIFHNIHEDEIELALFSNNLMRVIK